jgi:hypothetical protein
MPRAICPPPPPPGQPAQERICRLIA